MIQVSIAEVDRFTGVGSSPPAAAVHFSLKLPEDRWTDVNKEMDSVRSSLDSSACLSQECAGIETSVILSVNRGLT